MGHQSRWRTISRRLRNEPPQRVVWSRRGLVVVFMLWSSAAFLFGLLLHHYAHVSI